MPSPEEDLWESCTNGDLSRVKSLLNRPGINVNYGDPEYQRTPFYRCCFYGHLEIVRLLLQDNRIDVNQAMNNGATPFYIACHNDHLEVVRLLLQDNRIDVNQAMNNGATPFFIACEKGHLEVVRLLLQDNRIDINQAKKNDSTPLWIACQNGRIDVVKTLVASGRNLDLLKKSNKGNEGWNDKSPLEIAQRNAVLQDKLSIEKTEEEAAQRRKNCQEILKILESLNKDPSQTRERLRNELKWPVSSPVPKSVSSLIPSPAPSPVPKPGPIPVPVPEILKVIGKVKAHSSYKAKDGSQLSFNSGDILDLLKKDGSGWWEAELNGKRGKIPHTFVEDFQEKIQAIHPYNAKRNIEHSFSVGDVMILIEKDSSGWWKADFNGKIGEVPSTFFKEYLPVPIPVPVPAPVPSTSTSTSEKEETRVLDVELGRNQNPIYGLKSTPLVSLVEAVQYACEHDPDLQNEIPDGWIFLAKLGAPGKIKYGLTVDEVAAIHFYTQETPFYRVLNARLRSSDRKGLPPFFRFIKLLFAALKKLPPVEQTVFRGVKKNLAKEYQKEDTLLWWSFNSTAASLEALENPQFLGNEGDRTMFTIACKNGIDIAKFSAIQSEKEILLLPGTCLQVEAILNAGAGLTIIQLKQVIVQGLVDA